MHQIFLTTVLLFLNKRRSPAINQTLVPKMASGIPNIFEKALVSTASQFTTVASAGHLKPLV